MKFFAALTPPVAKVSTVAPIMTITSPAAASGVRPCRMRRSPGRIRPIAAEHLGHADEPQEQARQGHLLCQYLDWQGQLHSTGEQNEEREQPLNGPQYVVHGRSLPWRLTAVLFNRDLCHCGFSFA